MSAYGDRAKTIACDHCGAKTDQNCITSTGGRATYPHVARIRPLQESWVDGYVEGRADMASQYRGIGSSQWDTRERFEKVVDQAIADVLR